jgi:biofilm PGA synthesis N-glycosyltransferase PgaC
MIGNFSEAAMYGSLFISLFFQIFLLITYFENRPVIKKEVEKIPEKELPTVTIIVPCFNEEKTIAATLDSLLSLKYPKDKLRIMVVDDGSTDGSQAVLQKYRSHPQVEVEYKENGGKHTALNYALERIESDLVGCLDADSFVAPDALERIAIHFEDPEVMAVTPAVKVYEPRNVLQLIQRVEYGWGIFFRKMLSYLGAIYVTPGPFSIFRTDVFRKIGPYKHAHHTEDFEMAMRMQSNHMKIVNAHDASVFTVTPRTLQTLYKQRLRWTYGFLNNVIDYRFMLFRKEFGNIGLYILPMATLSVFTGLYFFSMFLWNIGLKAHEAFVRYSAVGFDFNLSRLLSFDWFFFDTGSAVFITAIALSFTLLILVLSRRLSEGRVRPSLELLYFLTLYAFIVPLWLSRSLWNTVMRRNISWR